MANIIRLRLPTSGKRRRDSIPPVPLFQDDAPVRPTKSRRYRRCVVQPLVVQPQVVQPGVASTPQPPVSQTSILTAKPVLVLQKPPDVVFPTFGVTPTVDMRRARIIATRNGDLLGEKKYKETVVPQLDGINAVLRNIKGVIDYTRTEYERLFAVGLFSYTCESLRLELETLTTEHAYWIGAAEYYVSAHNVRIEWTKHNMYMKLVSSARKLRSGREKSPR